MMYSKVKQDDSTGCGIACIAMMALKTYKEVRAIAVSALNIDPSGPFYTNAKDLGLLAKKFNIELGKKRVPYKHGKSNLPNKAILAINYNTESDRWHWVVYFKEEGNTFILDPNSKNDVRKDIERVLANTKWYLKIK